MAKLKKFFAGFVIVFIALITIISLSGLNFLAPTEENFNDYKNQKIIYNMEKVFFTTKDGVRISANFYSADNPLGWIVMVHMMPLTKESYDNLAKKFQASGYESLAIDLRGHGESDGGPDGFAKFSDAEHQKSILDLEAAVEYLENRGATPDKINFIGASIGANLALEYLAKHSNFKKAALLSAGLDYRGIKTDLLVKQLKSNQNIFLISAEDDGGNFEQAQKLYNEAPLEKKKIKIYDSGGHGTDILKNQPESEELIIDFIK